jgi:hypothetical protein
MIEWVPGSVWRLWWKGESLSLTAINMIWGFHCQMCWNYGFLDCDSVQSYLWIPVTCFLPLYSWRWRRHASLSRSRRVQDVWIQKTNINLCYPLNVRDQVSHPYTTQIKVNFYIYLIFILLATRQEYKKNNNFFVSVIVICYCRFQV